MNAGLRAQGMRFLLVGGLATAADATLFAALVRGGLDPRASNALSYPLSAILAFCLHRHWTFAARDDDVRGQAFRFALMVGAGLLLSTAIVGLLVPVVGPLPAKAVAIGGTLILNFVLARWLVFTAVVT